MSNFAAMKSNFSDILSGLREQTGRKLQEKLPSWAAVCGISIPESLPLEQCSSEPAANYKASLLEYRTVADLDSGLGADVWAFAKRAEKVWYNELRPEIAEAAEHNLGLLGITNVEFSNMDAGELLDRLPRVDLLFLDPARRSGTGRKVFLLEDCSPDVMGLMPRLWQHSDTIMLKLSPMADISLLERKLEGLCEVHIVSSGGECKELLCILRKGWEGDCRVIAAELSSGETVDLGARPDPVTRAPLCGPVRPGDLLLEPMPVLLKAGMDAVICSRWQLRQLDTNTHLFIADGTCPSEDLPGSMFRIFTVEETLPFCKESIRNLGKKYPMADVSARNIPLKSEELRKKMGITGSGGEHIFGVGIRSERALLVCRKH